MKGGTPSLEVSPISPKEPQLGSCLILCLVKVKFRRMHAKVRSILRNTWDGSGSKVLAIVLRRLLRPLIPHVLALGAKIASLSTEKKRHGCLFLLLKFLQNFPLDLGLI